VRSLCIQLVTVLFMLASFLTWTVDTGDRCSVVGPFLWPARRPGTRYQTTCEIRHVPLAVLTGPENFDFLVLLSYTVH